MTLISVYNSDGCVGRCDSRCYNATSPDCDCICGGRNHGAGLERAQDNTREHARKILETWEGEHPDDVVRFEAIQQELFGAQEARR